MSQKAQLPEFDYRFSTDKRVIFKNYCKYMFTRTQSMFVYKGLPDSIPVQWLENYLQRAGSCIIAKHEGTLYALIGNVSGERDAYYQPTKYIVANPWLRLSKEFTIDKDCVYCRNDYDAVGLTPLISRYCGLMTENLLTVRLSDINMRMMNLLSAVDDDTVLSTKQYLSDLEEGKLGVVAEDGFFEGIKVQGGSVGRSDYMIQFIELQQYLKGSLYNELGINANFNMKREAINGEEAAMNDDALMPLIDDMLKQRRIMCDKINEMFDLDVSVDYGSSWHTNNAEKEAVAMADMGASDKTAAAMAGDEVLLPDDQDPQGEDIGDGVESEVSRLNDIAAEVDSQDNGPDAEGDGESADVEDGKVSRESGENGSEGEEPEERNDGEDRKAGGVDEEPVDDTRPDEGSEADRETEDTEDSGFSADSVPEGVLRDEQVEEGSNVTVEVNVNVNVGADDGGTSEEEDVSQLKEEDEDDENAG